MLSTMKLSDAAIIPKSEEELMSMADSFVDLRPDGYAVQRMSRVIVCHKQRGKRIQAAEF